MRQKPEIKRPQGENDAHLRIKNWAETLLHADKWPAIRQHVRGIRYNAQAERRLRQPFARCQTSSVIDRRLDRSPNREPLTKRPEMEIALQIHENQDRNRLDIR